MRKPIIWLMITIVLAISFGYFLRSAMTGIPLLNGVIFVLLRAGTAVVGLNAIWLAENKGAIKMQRDLVGDSLWYESLCRTHCYSLFKVYESHVAPPRTIQRSRIAPQK